MPFAARLRTTTSTPPSAPSGHGHRDPAAGPGNGEQTGDGPVVVAGAEHELPTPRDPEFDIEHPPTIPQGLNFTGLARTSASNSILLQQ